jgi:hypothetical protein
LAIRIQISYLGLTDYGDDLPFRKGVFAAPPGSGGIGGQCGFGDNHGQIVFSKTNEDPSFRLTLLGVGQLIREAIIGELRNPQRRTFEHFISQIPINFPEYEPYGRCEYPHPKEHEHTFPYSNGIECFTGELARVVSAVLQSPTIER